jgi:hypothetical protein
MCALELYCQARGPVEPAAPFFRSRSGKAMSRGALYERVCWSTEIPFAVR